MLNRQLTITAALVCMVGFVVPAMGQTITDGDTFKLSPKPRFEVIDGDTVKFGSQLVRLFGIDAPKKAQTCDGGRWRPGPLAKKALEDFIAGRPVNCRQVDFDQRNQRPVAQCFAGDDDLQAMMVSAGWAWAFVRYSDRYVPEERDAVVLKAGVHRHDCVPAWEWRARERGEK